MATTSKNIAQQELIGLDVEVVAADNKSLKGTKGKIVDETKETVIVEEKGKLKRLIKKQVTLKLAVNKEEILIDGRILVGRPEDRLKRLKRLK